MFKRLLVPLDGSSLAEAVLPFARYLALRLPAEIILFHVVEKDAPNEIHGQHHLRGIDEAKKYLDQIAKQLSAGGIAIQQHVHEVQASGVAQTIRDHATELQADLIILCAHGRGHGGLREMLFGSIAEQVIRHGTMPVFFIRPEYAKDPAVHPIRQILVPLDGSQAHEVALRAANELAAKLNATLRLLTVVPTADTLDVKEAITGRVSPRATALALDISARQAEEYLARMAQGLPDGTAPGAQTVLRGDAVAKLIETIDSGGVDLVVMATHGHGPIDAHWDGSLTPRFLPKATVPVLLVRGLKEDA